MKVQNVLRVGALAALTVHQVCAFGGVSQENEPMPVCEAEAIVTDLISAGGPEDLVQQTGVVYKTGSTTSKFTTELGNMSEDTMLNPVWSASKMVSSILINKLADEGLLNIDTPVNEYIDWWTKDGKDPRSKVTLRHLLSMTAGFGSDLFGMHGEASCEFSPVSQEECAKTLYEKFYGKVENGMVEDWGHPGVIDDVNPGDFFLYGESSWVLAVYIAETVTGKTWRELFTEYVGTALGLDESCNYNSMAGEGMVIDGGASLHCNAKEYEKILMAYFNEELVSATTMKDMESAVTNTLGATLPAGNAFINPVAFGVPVNYGLGVWVSDKFVQSVGMDGVTPYIDRRDPENEFWGLVFREQGDLQGMETSLSALAQVAEASAAINKC